MESNRHKLIGQSLGKLTERPTPENTRGSTDAEMGKVMPKDSLFSEAKGKTRFAKIMNPVGRGAGKVTLDRVEDLLPSNYKARLFNGSFYVYGEDSRGWTLDDYVIPRLRSGLITAKEVKGFGLSEATKGSALVGQMLTEQRLPKRDDKYVMHDGIQKRVVSREKWKKTHKDFKLTKSKVFGKNPTRAMMGLGRDGGTFLAPVYVEGLDKGGIPESLEEGKGTVKITVKKHKGEWAAVYYLNGKYQEGPTYYAGDDKRDAESTAKEMRKEAKKKGFDVDESIEERLNSHEAEELHLAVMNDAQLYKQQFIPIIKNLVTKKAQGKYNSRMAPKLFMYLVDEGAKKYQKEHGTPGEKWNDLFPKNVRMNVASELTKEFEDEYDLGNWDEYIPKKYRKESIEEAATKELAYRVMSFLAVMVWDSKPTPIRVIAGEVKASEEDVITVLDALQKEKVVQHDGTKAQITKKGSKMMKVDVVKVGFESIQERLANAAGLTEVRDGFKKYKHAKNARKPEYKGIKKEWLDYFNDIDGFIFDYKMNVVNSLMTAPSYLREMNPELSRQEANKVAFAYEKIVFPKGESLEERSAEQEAFAKQFKTTLGNKKLADMSDADKKKFFDALKDAWDKNPDNKPEESLGERSEEQEAFAKQFQTTKGNKKLAKMSDAEKKKFFDELKTDWKKNPDNKPEESVDVTHGQDIRERLVNASLEEQGTPTWWTRQGGKGEAGRVNKKYVKGEKPPEKQIDGTPIPSDGVGSWTLVGKDKKGDSVTITDIPESLEEQAMGWPTRLMTLDRVAAKKEADKKRKAEADKFHKAMCPECIAKRKAKEAEKLRLWNEIRGIDGSNNESTASLNPRESQELVEQFSVGIKAGDDRLFPDGAVEVGAGEWSASFDADSVRVTGPMPDWATPDILSGGGFNFFVQANTYNDGSGDGSGIDDPLHDYHIHPGFEYMVNPLPDSGLQIGPTVTIDPDSPGWMDWGLEARFKLEF